MKFLRLLSLPFIFVLVGLMRLASPWLLIRFGELWTPRLGHLIGNTECYLSECDVGKQQKAFDIWVGTLLFRQEQIYASISNKYIAKKYNKKLHTIPNWLGRLVFKVNMLFPGWRKYYVCSAQFDRDIYGLWPTHSPHIGFTEKEEIEGKKLLRSLGIPKGSKWVCLIVRDSTYLKKQSKVDFSYHDYRDADVDNYRKAALMLVDRGYYVIRMGAVVEKPFNAPGIIDYATKFRSEFGDFYLGAKCAFCLGTPTGFMSIPQSFNRPCVMTDVVPLEYMATYCEGLAIWKNHLKDGKRMTLKEVFSSGAGLWTMGENFKSNGITLQNNTPDEIAEVSMEMCDRLSGYHEDEDFDIEAANRQRQFWKDFPRSSSPYNNQPLHGKIKVRIGREFLKGYS